MTSNNPNKPIMLRDCGLTQVSCFNAGHCEGHESYVQQPQDSQPKQDELREINEAPNERRQIIIKLINYVVRGEPSGNTRLNPKQAEQAFEALINSEALALLGRLEKQQVYLPLSDDGLVPMSVVQQEKQRYSSKEEV